MTEASDYRAQDDAARRVICDELAQTLFVEAGAGTGKTKALVDRIVALVGSGTPIEKIAAITFTERAAAELRERVRTGLEEEKEKRPDKSPEIALALESLDRAQISTIHAFCQAIVRTYAPEAGVDPDFEVQDEVMTGRRMQERWRRYLESLADNKDAHRDIDRLLSLGLKTDELEKLALGLASRGELAEIFEKNPPIAGASAWPDLTKLQKLLAETRYEGAPVRDYLRSRIAGVAGVIDALLARPLEDREELLAAGAAALNSTYKSTNDAFWPNGKDAAIAVVSEVQERLNELLRDLRAEALSAVMPRLVQFVQKDESVRGREGSLTFDDLILRAGRLVEEGGDALTSLRERYAELLIDEFQDTDPQQVAIATAFATDPATGEIESGRLFLVGDPKQSIYRFRRADMATYAHTADRMREAGATFPKLALNRRSRSVILNWVNGVFAEVIGDGDEPDIQPPYAAILPLSERDVALNGPGLATFGGMINETARDVRTIEARKLAALCRRAIEERWQVAERDGAVREAKYRDIAILIPRRTGLIALERELARAGVPYRVESGSLIYRTQEVRDLVNCLTAIDDPADEVAIVAALRGPAFACSDVDLARHKTAKRYFNYHNKALDEWDGPVSDGLRALRDFHASRHKTSLAALVERFVYARGTIETGVLDQRDRNSFRRARFMAERARTFEAAGPESLRAFVAWLENQSEAAILDNEGASVDDDEDAVRVLTIHGAKGLEFPIVFLAGLSAAPMTNIPPLYSADFPGDRVAICAGTSGGNRRFILGDFASLNGAEAEHLEAEFDRLLYVACTRARDHLVVSLYHNSRAGKCAAKRLIDGHAGDLADHIEIADIAGATEIRALDGLTVELPHGVDAMTFDSHRSALLVRARTRDYTSATSLIDYAKAQANDESEPWSRGRGGTRIGRAVHAAIQSLRLDADDAAIAAVAKAQAVAEAVPHRENDVVKLVRWVVKESDAWKRARGALRAMREVPFALEDNGTVLEGYIDLVLQTEDGIEIVDWKTDQIARDGIAERLEKYRLQAGLYVYGLETATGQRVSKVTYVFASPKVEESMGDPAGLKAAALEALAASRRVA